MSPLTSSQSVLDPWSTVKMAMNREKIKKYTYKKEGKLFTSITEAPNATLARTSPWCCCGRQRGTSLGKTGDTKEEYDTWKTKKKNKGSRPRETCLCRFRQWSVDRCMTTSLVSKGSGSVAPESWTRTWQSLQKFTFICSLTGSTNDFKSGNWAAPGVTEV